MFFTFVSIEDKILEILELDLLPFHRFRKGLDDHPRNGIVERFQPCEGLWAVVSGIENLSSSCLGLPDKQGFCLKSSLWERRGRKQLAGRKLDARLRCAPWAGRRALSPWWENGRGGAQLSR